MLMKLVIRNVVGSLFLNHNVGRNEMLGIVLKLVHSQREVAYSERIIQIWSQRFAANPSTV